MGVGVVMTSHFPDHALAAADKVAAFKGGAIVCAGTPEEVITAANMSALYDIQVDVMDTRRGKVCVAEGG